VHRHMGAKCRRTVYLPDIKKWPVVVVQMEC